MFFPFLGDGSSVGPDRLHEQKINAFLNDNLSETVSLLVVAQVKNLEVDLSTISRKSPPKRRTSAKLILFSDGLRRTALSMSTCPQINSKCDNDVSFGGKTNIQM